MTSHISALTQTLIIYLVMGAAYYGWGRAATYVLGIGQQTNRSDITLIWLGWAFTLFIFQLLHFLFPVTAYVVAPIFIIGAVFSIPQIAQCRLELSSAALYVAEDGFHHYHCACWGRLDCFAVDDAPHELTIRVCITSIRFVGSIPSRLFRGSAISTDAWLLISHSLHMLRHSIFIRSLGMGGH